MRRRPSSFLTSLLSSPSPKSAAEPSDLMAAQTGPEQPAQPRSSPPEPQSSQNGNDGGDESPRQKEKHARWCGYLEEGRWYCECNLRVRPLTVKKRGPNYGKQCKGESFSVSTTNTDLLNQSIDVPIVESNNVFSHCGLTTRQKLESGQKPIRRQSDPTPANHELLVVVLPKRVLH